MPGVEDHIVAFGMRQNLPLTKAASGFSNPSPNCTLGREVVLSVVSVVSLSEARAERTCSSKAAWLWCGVLGFVSALMHTNNNEALLKLQD
jgi:hypothetical protein